MSGRLTRELTLRFDERDRRRLVFASALTVVALPAVWLVNQDDDGVGRGPTSPPSGWPPRTAAAGTGRRRRRPVDPMGDVDARCSSTSTPLPPPPEHVPIAVGSTDDVARRHGAGDLPAVRRPGRHLPVQRRRRRAQLITVVNVDNGRSIECWTAPRRRTRRTTSSSCTPTASSQIADLTTAPIHVEIRQ